MKLLKTVLQALRWIEHATILRRWPTTYRLTSGILFHATQVEKEPVRLAPE
jgi:hypothetical protein